MKYKDLERFEKLGPESSEEARWEALKALEPCLGDLFIVEEAVDFGLGIPCRLTTFRGNDGTQAYVTVTDAGYVILGRVDKLTDQKRRLLGDFDPRYDEILSIAVSQAQRYTADTLDLWISVIRHPRQPYDVHAGVHLYHGIVAATCSALELRPPKDDHADQSSDLWQPYLASEHVPDWLKRWNVSTNPEDTTSLPYDMAQWLPQGKYAAIDAIAWTEGWLCYSTGHNLRFLNGGKEKSVLKLPERAYCLSLRKAHDGWFYGLAGCGDRKLLFFRFLPISARPIQLETLDERDYWDYPTAVHILPGAKTKNPVYDILVIERGGWLMRQRYVGFVRLRRVWLRLWKIFGSRDPSCLLDQAHLWIAQNPDRAECVARYALQACLSPFSRDIEITPEQRLGWLKKLMPLLRPFRSHPHFPRGFLQELLNSLLIYTQGKARQLPLQDGTRNGDFRAALLHHIFQSELHAADRQWTGLHLMRLSQNKAVDDDWIKELKKGLQAKALDFGCSPIDERPLARLNHQLGQWSEDFELKGRMALGGYRSLKTSWLSLAAAYGKDKSGESYPLLALAHDKVVDFYACNMKKAQRPQTIFATDHAIETMIALPPETGGGLAMIQKQDGGGTVLRILSLGQAQDNWQVTEKFYMKLPTQGFSNVLCACLESEQSALLTVLVNQGRWAKLLSFRLNEEGLNTIHEAQELQVPWVKSASVAYEGEGGHWLIASTDQSNITRLYHHDGNGLWQERREFNSLKRGTNAVAFCREIPPNWVIAGGCRGNIWCADLKRLQDNVTGIAWTHRLKGPVTFIQTYRSEGIDYFLIGSLLGELCLLRAGDGRQAWQIQLPAAALYATVKQDNAWVMVRGVGMVALGRIAVEHKPRLQDILTSLANVNLQQEPCRDWRISAGGAGICRLEKLKEEPVLQILDSLPPEGRAMLLRFLSAQQRLDDEVLGHLARHASYEELLALLDYLADEAEPLFDRIHGRLRSETELKETTKSTATALLRHLDKQKPNSEQILACLPPLFLKSARVQWELARVLLESVERLHPRQSLLPYLTPYLIRLPSKVVNYCFEFLKSDTPTAIKLRAVSQLLEASSQTSETIYDALKRLAECFREVDEPSESHRFLAFWIGFHNRYLQWDSEEPWWEQRENLLHELAGMIRAVTETTQLEPSFIRFAEALATVLPKTPLDDTETREIGMAWVSNAQRRLDLETHREALTQEYADWAEPMSKALQQTRQALGQVLKAEALYWQSLARPRIAKAEILRDDNNLLAIALRVTPEEDISRLRDVSVKYRVEGLQAPGTAETSRHYLNYPPQVREETIELSGFLASGQTEVEIEISLRAGNGYRNTTVWRFPLPKPASLAEEKSAMPAAVEAVYAEFRKRVFRAADNLLLVTIDAGLGRNRLLHDWDAHHPGCRLNLDERLRDYGPGRRYSAHKLDAELLYGEIHEAIKAIGSQTEAGVAIRLLVGPMDETLERLFVAGDGEAVRTCLARLLTQDKGKAKLLLAVSSRHACRLRAMGLAGLSEIAAHRLPAELSRWDSAIGDWIGQKTSLSHPLAMMRFEELGRDLRLLRLWLNASQRQRKPVDVQEFLKQDEPRSLLEAEFHGLSVFELSSLIAAALARCQVLRKQVVPGHYAAQDYHSTTQTHSAKLLQRRNTPFTHQSLNGLNADTNPPSHVLLQGISLTEPSEAEATALMVLLSTRKQELEATCRRLAGFGLGQFQAGVFRTGSPYREWIEGLYRQHSELPAQARDAKVFPLLAGIGRDPVELLRPSDVLHGGTGLDRLLAACPKEEREQLRRLASAWSNNTSLDAVEPTLRKALGEESQKLFRPARRWNERLLATGIAGLGLGRIELKNKLKRTKDVEPASYLFWLAGNNTPDVSALYKTANECLRQRPQWLAEQGYDLDSPQPRFAVTGPGAENIPADPERLVAVWRFADYARVAWKGGLATGLWQRAKEQSRLTAFSPYRTSGALPPGSRLFVGRDEEQEFILRRLPEKSLLVVGCRRMGKTSLLNQILHRLPQETTMTPIFLDLQGVHTRDEFWAALQAKLETDKALEAMRKFIQKKKLKDKSTVRLGLYALAEMLKKQGRMLAFLLNEIDAIAKDDPDLLNLFRGLNDQQLARFLFVGYTVIGQLGSPESPFFHFTEGSHYGGKAISLAELKPAAAEKLLDLLEQPPLQLHWRNADEKQAAYRELLARSYRIPWVLQRYGHLLIERMEKEGRGELSLEDVNQMLHEEGQVVWEYISQIEYDSLGFEESKLSIRKGFQVIFYALARKFYFLGGADAPIRDPRLNQRQALDLGFNLGDIFVAVEETVGALLRAEEWKRFMRWFDGIKNHLNRDLKLLTLTLILEPDPIDAERYAFLLHIFPLELQRIHGGKDPMLDDLIITTVAEFFDLIGHEERA